MIDTSNMGRGEEIAHIFRNISNLYPQNILSADDYNKLHEIAIQNPKSLSKDDMFSVLLSELQECLFNLGGFDDIVDTIMNYTEPCENLTVDDAKEIISNAEANGSIFPNWVTPEMFIAIYNDMNPSDEE